MNKNLILSAALIALLAGCSSTAVKKEEPKAAVEERNTTQTAPAKQAPDTDTSKIKEAVIDGNDMGAGYDMSALKDPNNILSKRSVFFAYDKDEVSPEYQAMLEAHAKFLIGQPKAKIFIQGNCDERGSREYNISLGQRRAVAVKKVLNVLGVQDKQIETVSFGEEKPKATCHDESCYKDNRRSDIAYEGE